MTVDPQILATRIAKIREELRRLGRLDTVSRDEFLASSVQQHAVERELEVIIGACLDIGHHVISREGLRRPNDYREVFTILREAGIIDPDLGRRLEEMASFRNRLVHAYLELDPSRVYEMARHELADIEAFVATIVRRYIPDSAR
ncbi:MAG: DUF86 domain-containing protein [Acidobacteria bacterium]|nr:DUF86 domain-containing protein [Acidobacteriota bacterium]